MSNESLERRRAEIKAKTEEFLLQGGEIQEVRPGKFWSKQEINRAEWVKDIAKKPDT
ncbi:hypothetical protein VXJ36_26175 [Pseudomonas nitroreducens]|uniref:hypothetical protein n=1 Tax=Pseudomonas nitroreducens TaxID=46680 RepID=UPI002F35016B